MSNKYIVTCPIYASNEIKIHLNAYINSWKVSSDRVDKTCCIAMGNTPRTCTGSPVSESVLAKFVKYLEAKHPTLYSQFSTYYGYGSYDVKIKSPEHEKTITETAVAIVKIGPEWLTTVNVEEIVQEKLAGKMDYTVQQLFTCRIELSKHVQSVIKHCKKWKITKKAFVKMLSECNVYDEGYRGRKLDGLEVLCLLRELYPEELAQV